MRSSVSLILLFIVNVKGGKVTLSLKKIIGKLILAGDIVIIG
jgi:hypothetical protein